MWRQVHSIEYRLEKADPSNSIDSPSRLNLKHASSSSATSLSISRNSGPTASLSAAINCLKRPKHHHNQTGISVGTQLLQQQQQNQSACSLLFSFFTELPSGSTALFSSEKDGDDHIRTILALLRMFHALSEHGSTLDDLLEPYPILASVGYFVLTRYSTSLKNNSKLRLLMCGRSAQAVNCPICPPCILNMRQNIMLIRRTGNAFP